MYKHRIKNPYTRINAVVLRSIIALFYFVFVVGCSSSHLVKNDLEIKKDEINDDPLNLLSEKIEHFGGMYYDQEGYLNVYIVGFKKESLEEEGRTEENYDNRKKKIIEAIKQVYGENSIIQDYGEFKLTNDERRNINESSRVILKKGEFEWRLLNAWYGQLEQTLMNYDGITLIDLDEEANSILIGVIDQDMVKEAKRIVVEKNVPIGAVKVKVVKPAKTLVHHDLSGSFNPIVGGIIVTGISNSLTLPCTLGVVGYRNTWPVLPNAWNPGFITNSHCTSKWGGIDGTIFYQPNESDGRSIGFEVVDPEFRKGHQLVGNRYSDSAFILNRTVAKYPIGEIVRTINGSTEIDTQNPRFYIRSKHYKPIHGQILNKVGMVTGWTHGRVNKTCVNRIAADPLGRGMRWLRCQYSVKSNKEVAAPGDSGSPVFTIQNLPDVRFSGILWGGTEDKKEFYFSPTGGIEKDLFEIRVSVGNEPPPPPPLPSCPQGEKCCWINNKTGDCFCVKESDNCPTNPFKGCADGRICCIPGQTSCEVCSDKYGNCNINP